MTSYTHSEDEKLVDEQPSLPETYHFLILDLDLHVEHKRVACFHQWIQQQIAEGHIDEQAMNKQDERVGLFTSWLHSLFTQRGMKPKRDLPPYAVFAEAPFSIERGTVVQIMRQFREEGVLPQQKIQRTWSSIPGPRWTVYDSDIFCYLREMRALRYDQAQQVVLKSAEARHSHLSASQISTIINHWMNDGYAVYQHIHGEKMKWIIPTRKGLYYAGFKQCAKTLSEKTLKHLYWVNAVRITLQEKFVAMTWLPDRDLHAEEVRRGEKHHWRHTPDAQVTFGDGKGFFDIEVQVSRPSPHAVERMMMENVSGRKKNPLHYYVNKKSERVVREVYDKLVKEECPIRSHIEIIDLETFLQG